VLCEGITDEQRANIRNLDNTTALRDNIDEALLLTIAVTRDLDDEYYERLCKKTKMPGMFVLFVHLLLFVCCFIEMLCPPLNVTDPNMGVVTYMKLHEFSIVAVLQCKHGYKVYYSL
jgi:hypothetical protein